MEEKSKKPSLFKQRIASLKPNLQGEGFPKPIKIFTPESQPSIDQKSPGTKKNEGEMKFEKTLIDAIKDQSLFQDGDATKISQDNWATVSSMSQQQREEMIKQIHTEVNESFINKIKKHSIKEAAVIPKLPQPAKTEVKRKEPEEKQQNAESWELLLKINIQTDKISYTEQNEENLISIPRMIEMVGSDNNQSQIIGSKIVAKLVDRLTAIATSKTRELVLVSYVPLHLSIIFEKCSYLLFETMLKKARTTTFRSAFVEITSHIAEILTKVQKYLSKIHKESLLKQLKALIQKCNWFKIDKQGIETLKSTLEVICGALQQHENKVENEDWKALKETADIMLQIVLLEQGEVNYANSYARNILEFVSKSSDLTEMIEVEGFMYEIVNKFVLRKNKELYLDLQAFRSTWIHVIDILAVKIFSKIVNIQLQVMFQVVFLARFAGGITWERIIASMQQLSLVKHMVPHFILFNTLSDQKSAGLREQNLQSLNQIFNWLSNVLSKYPSKLNPNFIINTLLELFIQEEEYYSQLDQAILQRLITAIATNPQSDFNLIFTEEKVRKLITNYGFNSFGNEVFTNLMLIVAIKGPFDIEALVLRDLMARYTTNFIGAAIRLSLELPVVQGKKLSTNQEAKSQILQTIKKSEQNLFIAYLSS